MLRTHKKDYRKVTENMRTKTALLYHPQQKDYKTPVWTNTPELPGGGGEGAAGRAGSCLMPRTQLLAQCLLRDDSSTCF